MRVGDLQTPALLVDLATFEHNVATMGAAWPGTRLRPHVKAFKSTALARRLAAAGHPAFCCATPREVLGMAKAGLGHDLLLANEVVDPARLRDMAGCDGRVTVAVDSDATIDAAATAGIAEVLVDVNVGMPRCGCAPGEAGRLAARARQRGLTVRGVMGYEGHVYALDDPSERAAATSESMATLRRAHGEVGGDVISGGATGTWAINTWVTELQAGSFCLMDTTFAGPELPFRPALAVLGTVISVHRAAGPGSYAVADVGLKALGMDQGKPSIDGLGVWLCADEHITFAPRRRDDRTHIRWPLDVGDRVLVWPAHIDPTVSQHQRMHVVEGPLRADGRDAALIDAALIDAEVVDVWPVDLRHW